MITEYCIQYPITFFTICFVFRYLTPVRGETFTSSRLAAVLSASDCVATGPAAPIWIIWWTNVLNLALTLLGCMTLTCLLYIYIYKIDNPIQYIWHYTELQWWIWYTVWPQNANHREKVSSRREVKLYICMHVATLTGPLSMRTPDARQILRLNWYPPTPQVLVHGPKCDQVVHWAGQDSFFVQKRYSVPEPMQSLAMELFSMHFLEDKNHVIRIVPHYVHFDLALTYCCCYRIYLTIPCPQVTLHSPVGCHGDHSGHGWELHRCSFVLSPSHPPWNSSFLASLQ